jgi:poly(A) polymerase
LDEPWVRAKYFVSENPSNSGESVEHYGQVILSRYPFKAFKHSFSKFKRVLLGEFNFNGRSTFIPVLHLTSNEGKNRDPKTKRMAQLQTIFERTCPPLGFIAGSLLSMFVITMFRPLTSSLSDDGTDAVIMGDFNFGDTEENDLIRDDIRDVWRELRPAEVGYTVDPKKNSIAKITCHNKNRYDRVLLRSMVWEPVSIRLLGDEATSVKLGTAFVCVLPQNF